MKTVLTGIKPTGAPHIGNYGGMIKPVLDLAEKSSEYKTIVFIADMHALNFVKDRELMLSTTCEVAATMMAFGLNEDDLIFFRQSDVHETFVLSSILGNYTAKGLLNRAHSYKAAVDKNRVTNPTELDAGINAGLYTYPILMAADILLYQSDLVPVGKDQLQHIEMARDIAGAFNAIHGPILNMPKASVSEGAKIIPGLDGRKMSKSYENTIPLFADSKELKKSISRIVTDSKLPADLKNPDESTVVEIYKIFAEPVQIAEMEDAFREGRMGHGEAKSELYKAINNYLEEPRDKYCQLMSNRPLIDKALKIGAEKAHEIAEKTIFDVKQAIGIIGA